VLIALFATFFISLLGGDPANSVEALAEVQRAQQRVKAVVRDDVRRDAAVAILDEIAEANVRRVERTWTVVRRFVSEHAEASSTTEDFTPVINDVRGVYAEAAHTILDARFRLRDVVTREEWAVLFPAGHPRR
jgi:hypothetical protein